MAVLTSQQRKALEGACLKARRTAEQAVTASLTALAVADDKVPAHLDEPKRQLRRGLRAKARQLGDSGKQLDLLIAECAYEQWHRLLFARFLAENNLLIHPEYKAALTLDECEELADSLDEPDGWSVAARFASEILPGIFRLDDPGVQLRLAADGRHELEGLLRALPSEIFLADDALGWVYQFWQKDRKDEVNASEVKVGGADLGPVTQLFTENYMVRFLLENSLGAWWAGKHPTSPLLKSFEYLRYGEDGTPAAGTFDEWPQVVAEVTVMDPCCGSGHFLIEAFSMLWQMRVEEERLAPTAAQDAVLRDNLFGLELDPRCVQIAMFNVALQAWKAGGGWRELPMPNIACSGIPVKAPVDEWKALGKGDARLENALVRLHILFRDADTLGSMIDPKRAVEITDRSTLQRSIEDVDWDEVVPLLQQAVRSEGQDPVTAVLGADAFSHSRAARYLSSVYDLIATNVPFLAGGRFDPVLTECAGRLLPGADVDLATVMIARALAMLDADGCIAVVSPQNWTTAMPAFATFRKSLMAGAEVRLLARLGPGAFSSISGEVVQPALMVCVAKTPTNDSAFRVLDRSRDDKGSLARWLVEAPWTQVNQHVAAQRPGSALTPDIWGDGASLDAVAIAYAGAQTGDDGRYRRNFWELQRLDGWDTYQTSSRVPGGVGGLESIVRLRGPSGAENSPSAVLRGTGAWGRRGIAIARTSLNASPFVGGAFNDSITVLVPRDESHLPALWAFVNSPAFAAAVRNLSKQVKIGNKIFEKLPFEFARWQESADEGFPDVYSVEPTQWTFAGETFDSTEPLHVAVARLVGYRWPKQPDDDGLNGFVDVDGIVCLPSVSGEAAAADQLQALLAAAYGKALTPAKLTELIEATGSSKRNLADWLQAEFFKQHTALFGNRPFVWHVWDRRADGFSALVNYHRLDRKTLEKLTYTYLGSWIERQKAEVNEKKAGAEARFVAATELQRKLELILEGEPPYDVYVRWKELREQAIGWNPDINDGVRFNIRPFVEAGVLRSKVGVNWRKDGGANPDGSERHNDLHYTNAQKQAARGKK